LLKLAKPEFFVPDSSTDGGSNILMKINDKQVCDSQAIYGKSGTGDWLTIDHMTLCTQPIKVSKGDRVTLEAYYDHETHPP
jgi:hypothetical protein